MAGKQNYNCSSSDVTSEDEEYEVMKIPIKNHKTDFVTLNKKMISEASKIVKESKNVKIKKKPTRNIHDVLKANGDQHDKIPRNIFEYAVNVGKIPEPTENKGLTYIRKSMSKYPKECKECKE